MGSERGAKEGKGGGLQESLLRGPKGQAGSGRASIPPGHLAAIVREDQNGGGNMAGA